MAFTTPIPELIDRNSNGLLGKHPSWERVRLGDVLTVQNGAAFKSEYFNTEGRGMPLLRIRDILPGTTETWYDGPYEDEYVVQPGDLVIGMDGDFNHALWTGPPAQLNQRVCRLIPHSDALRKEFIVHVLGGYLQVVNEATPSVTVKHLSSKTVAELLLPLPPREEQDDIVSLLDVQLTNIEGGLKDFHRALAGIVRFRMAVLSEAFGHVAKTAALSEVAEVQSGIAKGRPDTDAAADVPYIRTANVQAGYLDLEVVKTLAATPQQRAKHRLEPDDVLILEGGDADKVGRGWLWEGEIEECLHQNHVFAVRTDRQRLLPRYLAYFVNSPIARRYFLSCAKQTTNLASINKRQLKGLPVPLPDTSVQQATTEMLDRQLAAANAYERDLRGRLGDVQVLKQSVLAAAVAGELVSQRPDDSATTLLAEVLALKFQRESELKPPRKKRRAVLVGE